MKKEEFPVKEMKKWAWATTFEKEVLKLAGVKSAAADMDRKVMVVEYDGGAKGKAAIRKTLDDTLSRFLNKGFVK